jgi:hypothetical protein
MMKSPLGSLSVLSNQPGYVASQLSETHVSEARMEVEDQRRDDLVKQAASLVQIILKNPSNLKYKQLYAAAHELRFFMLKHPRAAEVIREQLLAGRSEANALWVDFILAEDVSVEQTSKQDNTDQVAVVKDAYDSNYPQSRSKDWSARYGSTDFNAFVQAGYFAGTNFNCKQKGINYKLRAYVTAGVTLFQQSVPLFDSEVVYAAINGGTSENRVMAKLFGITLKNEKLLPDIPGCPPETVRDIKKISPGLKVSYTMFVVVLPITFSAGVTANLYLKWGYQFCPQNLQAHVDLRPGVTVTASAGAEASIAVARGGIELSGSINWELRPTALIDGNQCMFGVNLHLIQSPAVVRLVGWYQLFQCSLSGCGYAPRQEHEFWRWQGTGSDRALWGEYCQAKLTPSFSVSCYNQPF